MKSKLQTTSFWLGLSGAIVLILDTLSGIFGINLYSDSVEKIIMSICSILIVLGIVTRKNIGDTKSYDKEDLLKEIDENNEN